jgi:hypothetical protein
MTNEERIYKLCEYVINLINSISYYNDCDVRFDKSLERIKDKIISIKSDIDNN